jgi:Ca-activated chloride channel family protein
MPGAQNYYEVLELARDASADDIRRAYRELVRRLHPDANPNAPQAAEQFLRVQTAYEVLSDPKRKAEYDASLPPEKMLVQASVQYSRSGLLNMEESQLVFALVELRVAPTAGKIPPPPLNVSLVLDRSTSMQGVRMDMVKTTAIELVRQLKPQDILSIISFSDRAEVLLPATKQVNQKNIENAIQMLQTGGATEIFQGLKTGYQEVQRNLHSRFVNHVILITDGRTYGDEEHCLKLAEQASHEGIGISGLGIGTEWNDAFLDRLTSTTGGYTMYIAKPGDIKIFLEQKFINLGKIYADGLKYTFSADPFVHLNYAFRLSPEAAPLQTGLSALAMGSIPREDSLKVILEFLVDAIPANRPQVRLAEGRVSMEIPTNTPSTYMRNLNLSRAVTVEADNEPPSPEMIKALSHLTLYRMQERADREIRDGKALKAAERLDSLATHLLELGQEDLARTVMAEAKSLRNTNSLSAKGRMDIKYGTRALLLPSGGGGKS